MRTRKITTATLLLSALVLSSAHSHAEITLDLLGGDLLTSSGGLMPNTGLVLLVADTDNNGFQTPTATSFVSGDDIVVFKFVCDNFAPPAQGRFEYVQNKAFSGNWGVGDPLKLYWFPDLALSATEPGVGTTYGEFRSDSVLCGSDIAWTTPTEGFTWHLNFLTKSVDPLNGLDNSYGLASHTVAVPEPGNALAATLIGGAVVTVAGAVRRFKAHRRSSN